ncbi:hypothetical protein MM26B8_04540 [Mycoplasmopsis meleagridis]|uniref:HTH lacI-type domain-containing protein n=1 Tax=Mycoplasmopsis meleagridis ATCC 25294 TaxID=1264554 RepID=A0A0F5H1J6_9BACT|nr:LacI family transcriptional regulator [Mycoplasmopsis meleagridis]KKB26737.1 hypothetical protein MMELEA_01200 [Mycoplasmopsis meleagridis ATCC 25294]KUH47565.1 hypothetical protein ASB56_00300 [Mycoplasmopsis meleagridis]OAD18146.1 hypothetical protein MM26B8_04540 [Mycoplasmopsis meleagridis]VEU77271.1 Uncharacterised protein [Mycoplasmopsis meleagridis]
MHKLNYKDISKLTGLSLSSISRYYNGGYISDKKREVIESILLKHDIHYESSKQNPVKSLQNSIFVVMPKDCNENMNEIIQGLSFSAKKRGKNLICIYSTNNQASLIKKISKLTRNNFYALVVFDDHIDETKLKEAIFQYKSSNKIFLFNYRSKLANSLEIDYTRAFHQLIILSLEKFNGYPNKIAYIEDVNLVKKEKTQKRNGFISGVETNKTTGQIYRLDPYNKEHINDAVNRLKINDYRLIICSSHNAYLALMATNKLNDIPITDIGKPEILDNFAKYSFKILEDWFYLGIQIDRMIISRTSKEGKNDLLDLQYVPKIIKNDQIN